MGAVIGIDLGTTNTVIATVRDGRPVALPDELGSNSIPSIVSFLPSGAVLVGQTARERRADDVRNTIYSVKRLLGRTWNSPEVSQALSRFPFELREGPGRTTFVIARGETYTLPEISAFVLRKAKSLAELELGEPVDRAVVTVPANFNELQRSATKVAGRVAGLNILRIINEPTAAALAFGHHSGNKTQLAVYDFGGGTFDLTLLRLTNDVFEVLATAGDTYLGGDDVDAEIVERIADRFIAEGCADPREVPEGLERLREAAERLKIRLSSEPDASIHLNQLEIDGAPPVDFLLTRRDLDSILRPIVERTFAICRQALASAKLDAKAMDDVLLVGGSTLDPYVRKRVADFFGRPPRSDVDPHAVVALGAALYAQTLTERGEAEPEIPIPPPPVPVVRPKLDLSAEVGDFRQKTQPFGKVPSVSDLTAPSESKSPGPIAPITAPPVAGPAADVPGIPGAPPSMTVPSTQDFSKRRTTGLGIGPAQPPAHGFPPPPPRGLPTEIPATLPGPEPIRDRSDELPVAKPAPLVAREPRRGPTVRVAAGLDPVKPTKTSSPDLSKTLSSPTATPRVVESNRQAPTTHRQGFGAPAVTSSSSGNRPPLDLPLVVAQKPPSGMPVLPQGDTASLPAPVVTTRSGSRPDRSLVTPLQTAKSIEAVAPRVERAEDATLALGSVALPDKTTETDLLPAVPDDDEPTIVRRSPLDLAEESSLPAATGSEPIRKRPVSLNEAEIRARYGNLPLIVGGKRVGATATDGEVPRAVPQSSESARNSAEKRDEHAATASGLDETLGLPLTRQHTEFAPLITPSRKVAASLPESELLELEANDTSSATTSRPAPSRTGSIRPTSRQALELEAELPVPELPPSSRRPPPTGSIQSLPPVAHPLAVPIAPLQPPRGFATSATETPAPLAQPQVPLRGPAGTTAENPPPAQRPQPPPPRRNPQGPATPPQPTLPLPTGTPLDKTLPIATGPAFVSSPVAAALSPPLRVAAAAGIAAGAMTQVAAPAPSSTSSAVSPSTASNGTLRRSLAPALLIDVTPLSLCVETAGGYTDVLVEKNTPVPCERTRDFVTAQDNQHTVVIRVAQGESPTFRENVLLGEVQLTGLLAAPRASTKISITFALDSDGMLQVRALDHATNRDATVEVQLVGAPTTPEVQQMMARHLSKGAPTGMI